MAAPQQQPGTTAQLPGPGQLALDGFGLSLLLLLIFAAEAFNGARAGLQSLAASKAPDEAVRAATPSALTEVWVLLAIAGLVVGAYVTARFVATARELARDKTVRPALPLVAWAALGTWFAWQVLGFIVVAGAYGIPDSLVDGVHLLAIALAAVAAGLGGAVPGDAKLAFRRGGVARLQLIFLLALFFLIFYAGFISDQMTDVLRAWGEPEYSRAVAGFASALLLGALVRASANRLLLPPKGDPTGLDKVARAVVKPIPSPDGSPVERWGWALVAVVLAIVLFAVDKWSLGFVVLVAGLLAVGTERDHKPWKTDADQAASLRRLAGTLGVVPVAILLIGLTGAAVDSLLLPSGTSDPDIVLTVLTILAFIAVGIVAAYAQVVAWHFNWCDRVPGEVFGAVGVVAGAIGIVSTWAAAALLALLALVLASRVFGERGSAELWTAWGVGFGVGAAVYVEPVAVPRGLGGFAIALLGAAAILALLHIAGYAGVRRRLTFWPKLRTPVVTIIALWAVFAWVTAPADRNRVDTVDAEARKPETLSTAVDTWLDREAKKPVGKKRPYVPMLLVAASGGGAKAAYWTDLVLDCAFGAPLPESPGDEDECPPARGKGRQRYERLFATSSASGGSIGISHLIRRATDVQADKEWVRDAAGTEVLSPLLAWGLFHDLPAFLAGLPTDPSRCPGTLSCRFNADRAAVQASAVAGQDVHAHKPTPEDGLLAQPGPVTIFNTAQALRFDPSGLWPSRRVVLSRLALAEVPPGSNCAAEHGEPLGDAVDGHDLLQPAEDVTLATAALLSARFPVLEPPGKLGTLPRTEVRPCRARPSVEAAKIRDGGTYENTGLLTLTELLRPVQGAIEDWKRRHKSTVDVRLIVVSIDDDVPDFADEQEYDEGFLGLGRPSVRSQAVRNMFGECEFGEGVTYRRISPEPHVGAQAATGWEVSETSRREDLVASLKPNADAPEGAGAQVDALRKELDGARPPDCNG